MGGDEKNVRDGEKITYRDGKKWIEENYKDGKLHGKKRMYLYINGGIYHDYDYIDGKVDGLSITYYANGEKYIEAIYKKDIFCSCIVFESDLFPDRSTDGCEGHHLAKITNFIMGISYDPRLNNENFIVYNSKGKVKISIKEKCVYMKYKNDRIVRKLIRNRSGKLIQDIRYYNNGYCHYKNKTYLFY